MTNQTTNQIENQTENQTTNQTTGQVMSDNIKQQGIQGFKPKYDVITVPGFSCAGLHSGVKRKKKDLGIVICDGPANGAAVFTQSITKAAPVILSQQHLQKHKESSEPTSISGLRALLVNSGNANACTGPQGMVDAKAMVALAADAFGMAPETILLASTGVIGVPMDMVKIADGIGQLPGAMTKDFLPFGQSMMTTDTYLKVASLKVEIGGQVVSLLGLAKGSGMIHPNMATMLGFIFTDAPVATAYLQSVLSEANAQSFNMISVDGDTSTNDMVVALASGQAPISEISAGSQGAGTFKEAISAICESLAIQIAKDGEGATKMLEVQVTGAIELDQARAAAKAVVSSSLVKAAFFGQDANWGRIACALGYSGAKFSPDDLSIHFESRMGSVTLLDTGKPTNFDENHAFEVLRGEVIQIGIDLGAGDHCAKAWGCDLSYDYVKINGAYRT